jgi:integrase
VRWADIDFEAGVVHVVRSLDRDGEAGPLKTEAAKRDVVLMPSLAKLLAAHKLASRHSAPSDPVFSSITGRPLNWRNLGGSAPKRKSAGRGLGAGLAKAGIVGEGKQKVRFHDLRHTFASLLIAQGADIVFVSRQMGHANASITLSVYAHLFDGVKHADETRDALEIGFGGTLKKYAG